MGPRARGTGQKWVSAILPKPNIPSDTEFREALQQFRHIQPLCFVEGLKTNEGFGISASFNPVTYQAAGGSDMIEVCLKTAGLKFTPPTTEGWAWCDSIKQFATEHSVSINFKTTSTETEARSKQAGGRAQLSANGELRTPLLAKVGVTGQAEASYSDNNSLGSAEAIEKAFTVRKDHVEQLRDRTAFELRLTSPGGQDLVRLNGDLNRLSILSVPEPSALDPRSVGVTLYLRLSGTGEGLEHSLEIRTASGRWAALKTTRNKQVVAELLLSKFLQPLHKPIPLWPPKGEVDG